MTLEELGQLIRTKREDLGLSVDDVAGAIKVSVRTLRAIESGSLQGLPNAVYTKGFIRSYGMLVKIDAEELNVALQEIFPPEAFDDAAPQMAPLLRPVYAAEMRRRFLGGAFLLLLLVAFIGGGWFIFSRYGEGIVDLIKKPFSAISPVAEEIPLVAAANASSPEPLTVATPSPLSPIQSSLAQAGQDPSVTAAEAAVYGQDAVAETSALAREDGEEHTTATVADASTAVSELEKKTLADKKHIVHVVATEDCYLGITADSEKLVHHMVHANESHAIIFNSSLKLLVGNAGGITVRYNGKNMGEIGAKAKPKLLVFPL